MNENDQYNDEMVINNVKFDKYIVKSLINELIDSLMLNSLLDPLNIIQASVMTLLHDNENFASFQSKAVALLTEYCYWWVSITSHTNMVIPALFDKRTYSSIWGSIKKLHTIYHSGIFTYLVDKNHNVVIQHCSSYKGIREVTSKVNPYLNLYSQYTILHILKTQYNNELNMSLNLPFLQRACPPMIYKRNEYIYQTIRKNIITTLYNSFIHYGKHCVIRMRLCYLNNFLDNFCDPIIHPIQKAKDVRLYADMIFLTTPLPSNNKHIILDVGCDIAFIGNISKEVTIFLYTSNIIVRGKVKGLIFNLYGNISIHTPQIHVPGIFSAFGTVSVNNTIISKPNTITQFSQKSINDIIHVSDLHKRIKDIKNTSNDNIPNDRDDPSINALKIYKQYFCNLPPHPVSNPTTSLTSVINKIFSETHSPSTPSTAESLPSTSQAFTSTPSTAESLPSTSQAFTSTPSTAEPLPSTSQAFTSTPSTAESLPSTSQAFTSTPSTAKLSPSTSQAFTSTPSTAKLSPSTSQAFTSHFKLSPSISQIFPSSQILVNNLKSCLDLPHSKNT
ncbi:hypothetical protein HL033_00525 [Neoehrlichia mikurensis]|uniref:Uncharacterized protein n=1 Tax=Neoehrlichia mikurensis TaxID=89586 RepID=A0A9Q9F3B4_9RICK|nr:hypothetical protein [Neoehrlichia mikurensis]QXK92057.1 hypothetical protein IAH97_00525 [Neoehrlichia mikurensis]QXK92514.1 hypothetical protein HUN61_00525 [Neoehrlichia mikurensis]QXK93750.1 hypothetical protein HL033_00525 [Neoehrlichia mikurensis]UTO55279.1 hypothetical protein LUA82_03755 [Neoehrlichia mikurensis]